MYFDNIFPARMKKSDIIAEDISDINITYVIELFIYFEVLKNCFMDL